MLGRNFSYLLIMSTFWHFCGTFSSRFFHFLKHCVFIKHDLPRIRSGKFGQVFRLCHKETGQVCAGKFYRARSSKERAAARKEIELMELLHHPKLVQCLGAYDSKPEMVMVLE